MVGNLHDKLLAVWHMAPQGNHDGKPANGRSPLGILFQKEITAAGMVNTPASRRDDAFKLGFVGVFEIT